MYLVNFSFHKKRLLSDRIFKIYFRGKRYISNCQQITCCFNCLSACKIYIHQRRTHDTLLWLGTPWHNFKCIIFKHYRSTLLYITLSDNLLSQNVTACWKQKDFSSSMKNTVGFGLKSKQDKREHLSYILCINWKLFTRIIAANVPDLMNRFFREFSLPKSIRLEPGHNKSPSLNTDFKIFSDHARFSDSSDLPEYNTHAKFNKHYSTQMSH